MGEVQLRGHDPLEREEDSLPPTGGSVAAPAPSHLNPLEPVDDTEQEELSQDKEEDGEAGFGTTTPFEKELAAALEEAFPLLLDRLGRAHFADWHRRMELKLDLAQSATQAVLGHCRKNRYIPGDLVGYLVTTARHLAIAAWKERRDGPVRFADLERVSVGGLRAKNRPIRVEVAAGIGEQQQDEAEEPTTDDETEYENLEDSQAPLRLMMDTHENLPPEYFLQQEDTASCDGAKSRRVQQALDELPSRQREALEIYVRQRDDSTFREMGALMGISADGFEKNLERAMKKMRQLLDGK